MKTSVLIVEDENLLLNSLRKALSKEGYQVITATSGEEALDSFKANSTDVVLLDVRLPGMDGIQVLQRIKSLDVGVPVVIMTAFSGIKGAVEAIKLGAYDYIAKPFDIEELKFVLARASPLEGRGGMNQTVPRKRRIQFREYHHGQRAD